MTLHLPAKSLLLSSDHHFEHYRVIEYTQRPFTSVEEMNNNLILKWNEVVKSDDTVIHHGDFAFNPHVARNVLDRLNGKIILVRGNHDKKILKNKDIYNRFVSVQDYLEIYATDGLDKQFIVCCHYAFEVWNKSHYNSWNTHGHSHNSLPINPNKKRQDVGVDSNNYYPFTYSQLKEIMDTRTFVSVDHHKEIGQDDQDP